MLPIFLLFLVPVGGGIPAGVLLAQSKGIAWPIAAGLYLVSDLVLALALEPILRLLIYLGGKVVFLAKLGSAMKLVMAHSALPFGGSSAGPIALIAIAFGIDPMTGRAAALAAGHGFAAGWTFAIAGDMLYYAVIALVTLRLNAYIRNPNITIAVIFCLMFLVPILVRRIRSRQKSGTCTPA